MFPVSSAAVGVPQGSSELPGSQRVWGNEIGCYGEEGCSGGRLKSMERIELFFLKH